jgi:putative membrane protein
MWHMGDGWGWWMLMGWVWMAVFWGVLIWAVYTLATRLGERRTGQRSEPQEPDALTILERRYARGELTTEDFEAMRAHLSRTPSGAMPTNGRSTPVLG